jgi:four helix bundle protein
MYNDFTDMPVWKIAMDIAEEIFKITAGLPKNEDYGLTSQLRRAVVSISANIAEAYGRTGKADKNKFYDYARGSAYETKSLLLYGVAVNYFSQNQIDEINKRIEEVIHSLNKIKLTLKLRPQS